jgi:hypothetical protein
LALIVTKANHVCFFTPKRTLRVIRDLVCNTRIGLLVACALHASEANLG